METVGDMNPGDDEAVVLNLNSKILENGGRRPEVVIAGFLTRVTMLRSGTESLRFTNRILRMDTEPAEPQESTLQHNLRLVLESDEARAINRTLDWQDDDPVASEINDTLLATKHVAADNPELRFALRKLLDVRGADLPHAAQEYNAQRWQKVIRELANTAIR